MHFDAIELYEAVKRGDLATCRVLIEGGVKADASSNMSTVLYRAAERGHVEICQFLLENGADAKALSGFERATVLHGAALYPDLQVEMVKLLLTHGANASFKREVDGATALHLLCRTASVNAAPAVTELARAGKNLHEAVDTLERLPLDEVISYNRPLAIARALVQAGASPSFRPHNADKGKLTPFQFAVMYGRRDLIEYFVDECGEDLGQETFDGRTMFDVAALKPDLAVDPKAILLSILAERSIRGSLAHLESSVTSSLKKGLSPI
jgi:ankyrin repeat protein